jgi:hypothetical protein
LHARQPARGPQQNDHRVRKCPDKYSVTHAGSQ